ncbi:hypothetical protein DXC09_05690 [Streptococcus vestibularis]|nr:hypothetical protein DXC09_05690 [Streptococcus vestibularis]
MSIFRRLQDGFKSFLRYKERQKYRENRKLSAVSPDTKKVYLFLTVFGSDLVNKPTKHKALSFLLNL